MLSHNNIAVNCEMLNAELPDSRLILPTTNDFQEVVPCVLPMYHAYGLNMGLISKLALGCKVVTLPRFHPEEFLTSLAEHKATFLSLVPPLVVFLGENKAVKQRHLEQVRTILCGAAPLDAPDADRVRLK